MPSAYLLPSDYAAYGLPETTALSDVTTASALIDTYLKRPEGVIWAPDASGSPCYMAALTPTLTFASTGAISPGTNVVVTVTGGYISPDLVGDVLVIDASDTTKTEACVVAAVGTNSVTLQTVVNGHNSDAKLESGRVILEERAFPANRTVTRVARAPVVRMLSVQGRYAYGRRSQQQMGVFAQPSILSSVQVFGGPPAWYPVDVSHVSVSVSSGEVWVPAGALVANFSDVRMRYVAGWVASAIPGPIKSACATLIQQVQNLPEMGGSIKRLQSGGTQIERFADTLLDAQTQALLDPFAARTLY